MKVITIRDSLLSSALGDDRINLSQLEEIRTQIKAWRDAAHNDDLRNYAVQDLYGIAREGGLAPAHAHLLERTFTEALQDPVDQVRMSAVLGLSYVGSLTACSALKELRRTETRAVLQMAIDNAISRIERRHGKVRIPLKAIPGYVSPGILGVHPYQTWIDERRYGKIVMVLFNEMTNAESIRAFKHLRALAQHGGIADQDARPLEGYLLALFDHCGRIKRDQKEVWQETAEGMKVLAPSHEFYALMLLEEIGSSVTIEHLEDWSSGFGEDGFLIRVLKNDILFRIEQRLAQEKPERP